MAILLQAKVLDTFSLLNIRKDFSARDRQAISIGVKMNGGSKITPILPSDKKKYFEGAKWRERERDAHFP